MLVLDIVIAGFGSGVESEYGSGLEATSRHFADWVRFNWVVPIVEITIGIMAAKFIFNRQITEFLTFICIAVCVWTVILRPEFLSNLALEFANNNQNWEGWVQNEPFWRDDDWDEEDEANWSPTTISDWQRGNDFWESGLKEPAPKD